MMEKEIFLLDLVYKEVYKLIIDLRDEDIYGKRCIIWCLGWMSF